MKTEPHNINGKSRGCWYYLDSGKVLYVANRRKRDRDFERNAWMIERGILEKAQAQGCKLIGVFLTNKLDGGLFMTPLSDFFDPERSFEKWGKLGRERGLPLSLFPVNPATNSRTIEKRMYIR